MLLEIHVKNLALIEKADVYFKNGFNVISGETGAGKSILIDSINVCLGAKASKNIIRTGKDMAYVELVFIIEDEEKLQQIKAQDFILEDNIITITRQISEKRSVIRVNDELVSAKRLQALAKYLIDIHGQHDNALLMDKSMQLELLDKFCGQEAADLSYKLSASYKQYKVLSDIIEKDKDSYIRDREADILQYEITEIQSAKLKPNELSKLKKIYKLLNNKEKIFKTLEGLKSVLGNIEIDGILNDLNEFKNYDIQIKQISDQLNDILNNIQDIKINIDDYLKDCETDEESLYKIEKRIDLINKIESKYGNNYENIMQVLDEKKKRLNELLSYEKNLQDYKNKLEIIIKEHEKLSSKLSEIRKKAALVLSQKIKEQLEALSFLQCNFNINISSTNIISDKGFDSVDFMISTNVGEPLKAVSDVASGGELSRIMLAIKSIMADYDDVDTMIFDEIDTGISGNTAVSVAKRLSLIGKKRQVICISHLAQIACMADNNFLIKKVVEDNETKTYINNIVDNELEEEIARLIGMGHITDNLLVTAREMLKKKYNTEFNL